MKTTINIGLNGHKNLQGIVVKKPFDEIRFKDIAEILEQKFGANHGIKVIGWCKGK